MWQRERKHIVKMNGPSATKTESRCSTFTFWNVLHISCICLWSGNWKMKIKLKNSYTLHTNLFCLFKNCFFFVIFFIWWIFRKLNMVHVSKNCYSNDFKVVGSPFDIYLCTLFSILISRQQQAFLLCVCKNGKFFFWSLLLLLLLHVSCFSATKSTKIYFITFLRFFILLSIFTKAFHFIAFVFVLSFFPCIRWTMHAFCHYNFYFAGKTCLWAFDREAKKRYEWRNYNERQNFKFQKVISAWEQERENNSLSLFEGKEMGNNRKNWPI